MNPKSQNYWTLYGNTCLLLDLNNKAMIAYKKGNDLAKEKEGWILGNIGNLYNNIGLHEKAIHYLNSAIEKETSSKFAHERLASSIKKRDEETAKHSDLIKKGRIDLRNMSFESNEEKSA